MSTYYKLLIWIFTLGLIMTFSHLKSQDYGLEWEVKNTGKDFVFGYSIKTDFQGNVIVAGVFWDTVDFDPGIGVLNLVSKGRRDFFIQKLDPNGNLIWAISLGGVGDDIARKIALDNLGNIYITGDFEGTVDFNPSLVINNKTSNGFQDMFLLKLDINGNYSWVKTIGGLGTDKGTTLDLDSFGNILIGGYYALTVDFDPGTGTITRTTGTAYNAYILKLNSSGNYLWVKAMVSTNHCLIRSLRVDDLDNIVVTGQFDGTVDFDYSVGTTNKTSNGAFDCYIEKFDASGNFLWVKTIGSTGTDFGAALSIDGNNDILITGGFQSTVDFDPGAGVQTLTNGYVSSNYLLKLTSSGNFQWVNNLGRASSSHFLDVETDLRNNSYVGGFLYDGNLILKFNSTGTNLWTKPVSFLPNTNVYTHALDINSAGDIYGTGTFAHSFDFSVSSCPAWDTSQVRSDAFVLKYWQFSNDTNKVISDSSLCAGQSVNLYLKDTSAVDSILWNFGDPNSGALNASTDMKPTHMFQNLGDYVLLLYIYERCRIDTITDTIHINPFPYVNLGADTIICEGDSVDIQLNDTSFMNVWGNGDSSFNIQILHADTITVMVYNMCGNAFDTLVIDSVIPALVHFPDDTILCANDSLLLDATIHFGQYIWSTGSMDSIFLVDSAGTYSVTATNFCGVDSDTITVYYDDSPITNLGPDSTYCLSSLVNLNASWSRAKYLWNTSDTTSSITANYSGNFSVQVTNLCGYDGDTVNIQYDIPISFNLGADTILCKGDSFVIAAPAHNATWLWNDGSVDSTIQVHESGVFYVLAKNKCGSFGDSIHVNTRQKPIITEQIMDTSFCTGFTYHVSVDRNNSRSIIWNFGSTSFAQSLDSAGTYSYTVENICGISQDTFTLDLEFPAVASLGNDTVICYGDPIVKSFPYADHTFLWNTGSTDSVKIITETGVYGVTIWTPANCESYAEFTVSNCDAQLYIPNAFTPGNGDNLNNSFKVEGVSVFKYHIVIYDRWGLQVFESTDINISWDGTINGQDAATGIYSYKIWFNTGLSSGTNFQSVTRVGLVNLVR